MADTLLGHLARFASFFGQGELLCTQGLGYLLADEPWARAFEELLSSRSGHGDPPGSLSWVAEWSDGTGRTDLAGFHDTTPTIIVEAKLSADFGDSQLRSYAEVLRDGGAVRPLLVALVPVDRVKAAGDAVVAALGRSEDDSAGAELERVTAIALSWEDVFSCLEGSGRDDRGELAQLRGLYDALAGLDIVPFAADLPAVSPHDQQLRRIVDLATQRLSSERDHKLLPLADRDGFYCRYVCRCADCTGPCFAIGVRPPFVGHATYVWLRYHQLTPDFVRVKRRVGEVERSGLGPVVHSGGNIWIPIDVLDHVADIDAAVAHVVAEAASVEHAIWTD